MEKEGDEEGNPEAQRRRHNVGITRKFHADVVPMRVRKHVVGGGESTGNCDRHERCSRQSTGRTEPEGKNRPKDAAQEYREE